MFHLPWKADIILLFLCGHATPRARASKCEHGLCGCSVARSAKLPQCGPMWTATGHSHWTLGQVLDFGGSRSLACSPHALYAGCLMGTTNATTLTLRHKVWRVTNPWGGAASLSACMTLLPLQGNDWSCWSVDE